VLSDSVVRVALLFVSRERGSVRYDSGAIQHESEKEDISITVMDEASVSR
jgi:hypothetical protein